MLNYLGPAFYPHNGPPGPEREGCNPCPINSFSKMEIGARLAGTDICQDEHFCGKSVEEIRVDCLRIWARLYVISRGIGNEPFYPKSDGCKLSDECKLVDKSISILGSGEYLTLYEEGQRGRFFTLNTWKRVIREIYHSPEEVSDDEAIIYVRNFTQELGSMFDNCPKHP